MTYLDRLHAAIQTLDLDRVELAVGKIRSGKHYGGFLFTCGNGGSAATASHFSADVCKNAGVPSLCLNDNTAMLTAIANDLDYSQAFSNPLTSLCTRNDTLAVFSVSGNSPSILAALWEARKTRTTTVSFLGCDGGEALQLTDIPILIPYCDYAVVEDVHLIAAHIITETLRGEPLLGEA